LQLTSVKQTHHRLSELNLSHHFLGGFAGGFVVEGVVAGGVVPTPLPAGLLDPDGAVAVGCAGTPD